MDLQKEKIAHEKHLLSQGVDFKYLPNIQYNELENVYELIEWGEEYSEALNEINSSWCTWQAAKAQAVPEGFVLVDKHQLAQLMANMDSFGKKALGEEFAPFVIGQSGTTKTFTAEQASALYHILVSFGYKDECKGLDTKLPFELIDIKKEVL